jgi:hypothetical protein
MVLYHPRFHVTVVGLGMYCPWIQWSACIYSSVGIATGYGLDGPGIEARWGRDFPYPSRVALGPTQPPMGTGSFPGVKRPGRGVDHPHPFSAKVKERVKQYLSSPLPLSFRDLF